MLQANPIRLHRGYVTMENALRTTVGLACAYEAYALATGKSPTLSKVCRQHRWFEMVLFGTLIVHFHNEPREKVIRYLLTKGDMWHSINLDASPDIFQLD